MFDNERDGGTELAKRLREHRIDPTISPGKASGKRDERECPQAISAQCSGSVLQTAVDRLDGEADGTHHERKPITPQASAAPVHRNDSTIPRYCAKALQERRGGRTAPAACNRDDRRQYERHMNKPIDKELAWKSPAGERVGGKSASGRARKRCRNGDPERQEDGCPLRGRKRDQNGSFVTSYSAFGERNRQPTRSQDGHTARR